MKYFTKEELEDITKELIENPTRETLKNLNEKYNGSAETGDTLVKEMPALNMEPVVAPVMEEKPVTIPVVNEAPVVAPLPVVEENPVVVPAPVVNESPVVSPIPNFNIPNMEVPKVENNANSQETPFFELPKLETPVVSNQSNEPVNFCGYLFDTREPSLENLMQTTDNFNSVPHTMPTTEVPVASAPFFGPHVDTVNNPIPVGGPVNNVPNQGPTMFGQMQQNYM